MQDKPNDDHEGDEDVERDQDQKGWNAKAGEDRCPADRTREPVDKHRDTDCCTNLSVQSVEACPCRGQMRTQTGEVHEAGESDDPEVLGIYYITTVELDGLGIRHLEERMQH